MPRILKKLAVILLVLFLTGLARLPFEQDLADELRERGLIQAPIDLDTRDKLGQTTYAVALGGLRSLVAAMKNIAAHAHFSNQEWFELEEEFKTITTLQPTVRYYWETGSWHLAYNAYADYSDKPGIPEARRRLAQKDFLARGRRMLEEGVENNPGNWRLYQALGRLLTDPFKPKDYEAAASIYRAALALEDVPQQLHREYLYTLCRIPGREQEAWEQAQKVFSVPGNRKYPTTQSIFFTLQEKFAGPADRLPLEDIFGTRRMALRNLCNYSRRKREGFPMFGVRKTIGILIEEFRIPDEFNPLTNPDWRSLPPSFYAPPAPARAAGDESGEST